VPHALSNSFGHDAVVIGPGPTAVLEAAAAVFVGSARRLHDAVECKVNECHDSAHLRSPRPGLACRPSAGCSPSKRTGLGRIDSGGIQDYLPAFTPALIIRYGDSEVALTLVADADTFQSRHRTHPVRGKGRAHLSNLS